MLLLDLIVQLVLPETVVTAAFLMKNAASAGETGVAFVTKLMPGMVGPINWVSCPHQWDSCLHFSIGTKFEYPGFRNSENSERLGTNLAKSRLVAFLASLVSSASLPLAAVHGSCAMAQSFVVAHGNDGTQAVEVLHPNFRTAQQFETVKRITEQPDFAFACCTAFGAGEGKKYTGPFAYLYYTRDGALHSDRIGARGNFLQRVVTLPSS